MTRPLELTGYSFGRLTVTSLDTSRAGRYWHAICACGNTTTVRAITLNSGKTRSCGCLRAEACGRTGKRTAVANSRRGAAKAAASRTRHGHATRDGYSRTYHSWEAMHQRCSNPKNVKYRRYGGRGIVVCERWRSFENFIADVGERPLGRTLDRINPDGNYEPGNCRWATPKEQAQNYSRVANV